MSDINFQFPWYTLPLIYAMGLPYGLGTLIVAFVVAGIPALIVTALLGRPLIDALRRGAARQTAYEDAPPTHQAKTGTPTMGGLLFGVAPLVALLLQPRRATVALAVLVYGCMAIGILDDVMSIRSRTNRGLRALPKFALTGVAAVLFLILVGPEQPPLLGLHIILHPALWYGLSIVVVLATTHAVNLTDGLDGLASGTVLPPLLVLTATAGVIGAKFGIPVFGAAMAGAVLGFLIYNRHPARVFMGDTGSLALGGALAGIAILTGAQLFLVLIGGVFAAETLSVIIQVASFKTTRRRVFLMSPLHHHFELAGWPETRVTTRFWIASLILSLLGLALITRIV